MASPFKELSRARVNSHEWPFLCGSFGARSCFKYGAVVSILKSVGEKEVAAGVGRACLSLKGDVAKDSSRGMMMMMMMHRRARSTRVSESTHPLASAASRAAAAQNPSLGARAPLADPPARLGVIIAWLLPRETSRRSSSASS